LERRIGENSDITMPELAAEMAELGVKITPRLAVALAAAARLPV